MTARIVLGAVIAALALTPAAGAAKPDSPKSKPAPIVFVHGNSGSAQQFESNAMRFTSNGFPQRRLFVYEYDTSASDNDAAVANLEPFIASVMSRTGSEQVDVLAHSRGTTVMHAYLDTPARAASVRRYVNFDGRWSEVEPGGVETLAIWGEGDEAREIGGAENVRFENKAHTEVTTSSAAFRAVYRFLRGREPRRIGVKPEKPSEVTVKGRALIFPNNEGIEGGTLRVYRVAAKTGQRKARKPIYTKRLTATGNFGPIEVNGRHHYEFEVSRTGESTIHNYPEPFERDNHFYRVLTAPLLDPFIERSPDHVSIAVTRMREFWGDRPNPGFNDRLTFDGRNVITPGTAPRERRVLAVFNFDKSSDGVSDTSVSQPPFSSISFLTGVDNFLPSSADASGSIAVTERTRKPFAHRETINVPDWPSDAHTASVYFKDYPAREYKKKRKKSR